MMKTRNHRHELAHLNGLHNQENRVVGAFAEHKNRILRVHAVLSETKSIMDTKYFPVILSLAYYVLLFEATSQ